MPAAEFEIEARPTRGVRLLGRAMLAAGALGIVLAAWIAAGHESGWYLIGFGALMLWAGWRHARFGLAWGVLRVDAAGRGWWSATVDGSFVPVSTERWSAGERLVWIRFRGPDGRRQDLLLARGEVDDERWRRLASWLTWLRRGKAV